MGQVEYAAELFSRTGAGIGPDFAAEADERALIRHWKSGLHMRLNRQERNVAALRMICGYTRIEIAQILGLDQERGPHLPHSRTAPSPPDEPGHLQKLLITEDGITGAILATPFADLYCEDFAADLDQATQDLRRPRNANHRPLRRPVV